MRRDLEVHGVAGTAPFSDDSHAIADQALGRPVVIDDDATSAERMAMRDGKSHYPTCSTTSVPAGSGLINAAAGTDGSSQSAQAPRSRMTICRS